MPPATPDDLAAVKAWFAELAEHVRAVDFAAARHLFAEDFIAFGTFTDFMIGRELAEDNQWRNVWPTIDGFAWRLDDAKALVSPDRLFAVGLAVWDSTGYFRRRQTLRPQGPRHRLLHPRQGRRSLARDPHAYVAVPRHARCVARQEDGEELIGRIRACKARFFSAVRANLP